MAVLPARPPEQGNVLRNLLFPIPPKTVFEMVAEGGRWDGYFRPLRGMRRRRGGEQKTGRHAIGRKPAVVGPCLKPDGSGMILDAPTALQFRDHSPLFPKLPVGGFFPRLDGPQKDPVIGG